VCHEGRAIITVGCEDFQRPGHLGMLPIQNIPQLPKSAREVLPVVDLILLCLQEALAFDAGLWD
jgi:hypothetical protein